MPHRSSHLPCLQCSAPTMELAENAGISYLRCSRCQGVWIREPEFLSLMEQARPGRDNELLVHNDGSHRRHCPICAERMDIAWMLFLQMERCEEHGIWFDTDELERALAGDIGSEVLEQVNRQAKQRHKAEAQRNGNKAMGAQRDLLAVLKGLFK